MSYEVAKQQVLEAWVPGVGIEASSSHTDFFAGDHLVNTRGLLAIGEVEKAKEYFDIWHKSLYPDGFSPHYMLDPRKTGLKGFIHGKIANKTIELPNDRQVSANAGAPTWNIVALEIFEAIVQTNSESEAINWITGNEIFRDLVRATYQYTVNRFQPRTGRHLQLHPYELTLGNGVLAEAMKKPSSSGLVDTDTAIDETTGLGTEAQRSLKLRSSKQKLSNSPAFDIAVDAQAKQNVDALQKIMDKIEHSPSSKLDIVTLSQMGFIFDEYQGTNYDKHCSSALAVLSLQNGDNVTPDGFSPIEYWLASSRHPQISEAIYFDLISLLSVVAKKYPFGIPTLMAKGSEQQTVQADQGSVSPRLVFEIVRNILSHKEPGQIIFGWKIPALDDALAEIFENTAKAVGDTFPRHINPTDGSPTTAKNPLSRRQERAQAPWIPTATALLDAKAKLEKYGIV